MENIRILFIEDDKIDQMAFKRSVKDENLSYNYTIAGSVLEAKKILNSQRFDIVIADYSLGDGTAFDVFDLIMDTPIIIVTGSGNEKVAVEAMKAGAYDYLVKDLERKYLKVLPITVEKALKRRRAEKQFSMLSHAIMSINDSVYITDMDDRIIFVNKAFCKTYGYEEEDIIGRDSNVVWKVVSTNGNVKDIFSKAIEDGQKGEFYHRRRDGSEFPISLSRSAVKDENGNKVAVVGIAHDISDRKQAETEIQRLNLELEDRIIERTAQLEAANKDLKKEITERRQADEARLASEERYRALFENMVEGYAYCKMLFEHDQPQDFIYVDVNPAFEALTGLKDVVGQKVTQVVPDIKESNPELFEIYGRVSLTGKPERFETYLPALGIWFSISVFSPAKGYFVAVFDSVTERKRTEEDLRETNQVLRALVQASPLAIVALDYDGNLTRWNPAAERIFGWSQPEVLGKLFPGILQENLVDFRAKQRQMLQGQTIAIEVTHQKKDCSLIDINVFAAPMYDAEGKISSTMAVISDITERKRVEEALQRSEEKYRDLVNGINEGIFIHDNQGVITFANQTLANIHGFKGPEEIVGRKFTEFVSPATANDTIETFKKGMETGNYPEVINSPIIRTDGSEVFVEVRPSIIRDDSGKVVGGRGILQDVTERKRAEEEILRLNAELEQRVIERTAELEAANKELEAFSYSVSHDLRAPLRAIDGFSRFLFEDYSDILDDEGRRMINVIRQNTQNMGRLIDDLLSFSRLGRQEVKQSQIDMGELARAVFDELKPNTHERTMQLNINALPYAYVDRAMIQQVFVNLLSNAVKFTKPKEVAVIEVGGSTEGEENIYYVRDNGVGFDMRYIDKLFGVFQRLHRQDEFEGTGVGLALVKRIIHRHGGRVWAEGKMGEGATFYFTLPGLG